MLDYNDGEWATVDTSPSTICGKVTTHTLAANFPRVLHVLPVTFFWLFAPLLNVVYMLLLWISNMTLWTPKPLRDLHICGCDPLCYGLFLPYSSLWIRPVPPVPSGPLTVWLSRSAAIYYTHLITLRVYWIHPEYTPSTNTPTSIYPLCSRPQAK